MVINIVIAIGDWCSSRPLQLNPSKTELLWFGTHVSLKKFATKDLSLRFGSDFIVPVKTVRDLGVTTDSDLIICNDTLMKSPVSVFTTFDVLSRFDASLNQM